MNDAGMVECDVSADTAGGMNEYMYIYMYIYIYIYI